MNKKKISVLSIKIFHFLIHLLVAAMITLPGQRRNFQILSIAFKTSTRNCRNFSIKNEISRFCMSSKPGKGWNTSILLLLQNCPGSKYLSCSRYGKLKRDRENNIYCLIEISVIIWYRFSILFTLRFANIIRLPIIRILGSLGSFRFKLPILWYLLRPLRKKLKGKIIKNLKKFLEIVAKQIMQGGWRKISKISLTARTPKIPNPQSQPQPRELKTKDVLFPHKPCSPTHLIDPLTQLNDSHSILNNNTIFPH